LAGGHQAGLWACGTSLMQRYRFHVVGGQADVIPMRTAVLRSARTDDPTIIKGRSGEANIYRKAPHVVYPFLKS